METKIARRPFLLQSSSAVTALALTPNAMFAGESSQRFGGLPIGMQSYSLRKFSVEQAMRHLQSLGLANVEFFSGHYSIDSSPAQIARMSRALKQAGVRAVAHGVNAFTKDHDANRRVFDFAKQIGIKNITADPAPDSFDSLDKLVDEYKIRICIHNHGPGHRYDKLSNVRDAVNDHHPLVGACIDTGHVLRSGEDPVDWVNALADRVFALHLKDVAEQQRRTHDVVLGTGHLQMDALFQALKQIGFPADGSLSIEYESNPDNPIDDIQQCLTVIEKTIQATHS